MSQRFVCVHNHFYQPPREDPATGQIPPNPTAEPFHNWNERITEECYRPNTAAVIIRGKDATTLNTFSRTSFNVGPTLMRYLAEHHSDVHDAIVAGDRDAQAHFGHGSAIAQVYNHVIMPLADRHDQATQVRWGIADFAHRFGRRPEGMWLAECAADVDTLETLATEGIRFTILSPYQAKKVRELGHHRWRDVDGGRIDPTMPYRVNLPSGRSIAVFFYDGPISQGVAFEGLLHDGERFARRLADGYSTRPGDQLVNIATDGESYGHHHRHGEMALAYAIDVLDRRDDVTLTIYGAYLDEHPPTHEARIHSPSAWSCAHGVGRWQRDCGCRDGDHGGTQAWRSPLRSALDSLRDLVRPHIDAAAAALDVDDVYAARDHYIEVLLDPNDATRDRWLAHVASRRLDTEEADRLVALMELHHQMLLMYTSCGWFFDEISRIEPVQLMRYAARAVHITEDLFGRDVAARARAAIRDHLRRAPSNVAEYRDGWDVWQKKVAATVATR